MSSTVTLDATLQGLWDLARNAGAPAPAQRAAADAALKLQSASPEEREIAIAVAAATLTALAAHNKVTKGPQVTANPTGGVKAGTTVAYSPATMTLRELDQKHPDAIVIIDAASLESALAEVPAGFERMISGRTAPDGPPGFRYVLTRAWGNEGGEMELRPKKIILGENATLPHVESWLGDSRYVETDRLGPWTVHELMSNVDVLYRDLNKARKAPDARAALMKVIGDSDELFVSPQEGALLVAALMRAPTSVSSEQVLKQFYGRS